MTTTRTPAAPSGPKRAPAAPAGAKTAGRRLWTSVVKDFELDEHELALLREAVRITDFLDVLHAEVLRDGPIVLSPQGTKANPAAVEARQQQLALAKLLGALRLPAGDEEATSRPQRRVGVRGVSVPGLRP